MPGSEDHISKKQHISEVTLVVANFVVRGGGMVGVVGCGSRDQTLKHPCNRMTNAIFVQGLVPSRAGVRSVVIMLLIV